MSVKQSNYIFISMKKQSGSVAFWALDSLEQEMASLQNQTSQTVIEPISKLP